MPDEDALTPDIGAEVEPPVGIGEPAAPAVAAWAWPVILDQIFPKMLMDAPLSEGRTNCSAVARIVINPTLGKRLDGMAPEV